MKQVQILKDTVGNPTGVFLPYSLWEKIKIEYPSIDNFDEEIPQWEKDFIDSRLEILYKKKNDLIPIEMLFEK